MKIEATIDGRLVEATLTTEGYWETAEDGTQSFHVEAETVEEAMAKFTSLRTLRKFGSK